jgi:hypothetical protein
MTGRFATLSLSAAAVLFMACGKSADSFSLLADGSSFKQNSAYVPRKVDVLWVIDNSGSMATSQQKLASNFKAFIRRFTGGNTDFRMAVTTTDAYLVPYYNDTTDPTQPRYSLARLRPGKDLSNNLHYTMDPSTPDLENVFLTAIQQGISGAGDERAFSSFEQALSSPLNTGFHRPGAFLSVIIVSDEDDFSHNDLSDDPANRMKKYYFSENYNDPNMYSITKYTDFLKQFTAGDGAGKNFSVNSISSIDEACATILRNGQANAAQKVSHRYFSLVDATGGVKGSLCSDFGQTLDIISGSILNLSSVFQLNRVPNPDTIVIYVNGVVVPPGAVDGWTYDAATNSISFNGTAIPAAGADVNITFDPAGVKN